MTSTLGYAKKSITALYAIFKAIIRFPFDLSAVFGIDLLARIRTVTVSHTRPFFGSSR